jgi:hypothetical protein
MSDLTKLTTQQLVARGVKAPVLTALLNAIAMAHVDRDGKIVGLLFRDVKLTACRAELAALTNSMRSAVDAVMAVLPRHEASMTIEHNAHRATYETVEDYAEFREWDDGNWVSVAERDRSFATQELWEIQWYPNTPIGFSVRAASSLHALLTHFATPDSIPTPKVRELFAEESNG